MATLKHINSKNADYGAAEQYLLFEHDEFTMKPVLDETGRLIPREDYRLSTLNCGGEDFAVACMRANLRYGKNQRREDVKSHHYIISFDPRDGPDNGLTVDRAQELGDVGVVFYDLSSGKGVTYNADAEVYGASSYKALYVLYVCESLVETGQVSLDDSLGTYGGYNMGWQTVRDLIEAAVVNSDNDSFIALRAAFDHDGYEDWIANLGVDDETALNPMSDFPTYCPRTSARLWREMSEYLSMDTETSQWLSGLLASTSRSFIRDGIADEQVLVRNKAGWISEDGYYSTCDAGLIDIDGRTYVMSVMTSMPWSDRSSEVTAAIAKALFDTRAALA